MIRSFAVLAISAIVGSAGRAQSPSPNDLRNIQVLKGLSRDQVIYAMGFISQSLGVTCDYCHVRVDRGLRADLDDKKEKQTARAMLSMTKAINDRDFGGRQRITCATCHDGHTQPAASNPVVDLETLKTRLALGRPGGSYPAAAALLAKYERAIGGSSVLAGLKTRIDKYTVAEPGGTWTAETFRQAPNKWAEATTRGQNTVTTWVFDGAGAKIVSPAGSRSVTGLDRDDMAFTADFWRDLKLSERYSSAETIERARIDGGDMYVVRGHVKGSAIEEQLWLDAESGLLRRRMTYKPTALGSLADQTDFEDYRVVDGVKVPFLVKTATGAFATIRTYTEIRFNARIDDTRFDAGGNPRGR